MLRREGKISYAVICEACGMVSSMEVEQLRRIHRLGNACRRCSDRRPRGPGGDFSRVEKPGKPRRIIPTRITARQLRIDHEEMTAIRDAHHLPVIEEPSNGRPTCRSECADGPRPCPYVSCRYHLALDVHEDGALSIAFDPEDAEELGFPTCALDVADAHRPGEITLDQIGQWWGMSRERVRQIDDAGRATMLRAFKRAGIEPSYSERESSWDELEALSHG